ncbi:MAG: DUF2061 domain-containing protein [Candidatus Omnitrophota bacterium]
MENHRRTLAKTFSWRIVGFLVTTGVLYLFNRDVKKSLIIMGSADFIKIFIYYIHERFWNKIKFGRIKPSDYQI